MLNRHGNALKILFILIFLHTIPLFSQTQGKLAIAVVDLDAPGLKAGTRKALSDRLRNELFYTGRFSVMERHKMEDILKEQGFQQSGCTSKECVVEVGRILGVKQMISGSVGKVGTIYTISLRMIDIETGRIMLTKTEDCNCPIEMVLTTALRNIAIKMAGLPLNNKTLREIQKRSAIGTGDFYFKSEPVGATVYIDEKPQTGVTPLTIENIPTGIHQISMKKGNYSGSQTVYLEPNEFKRVEIKLVKAKGSLKIISQPLEADIFLDNKYSGKTPQTLSNLDAGEHRLKLSKSGYEDYEQVLSIKGNKQERITVDLPEILPATLKIISQPADCDVYLNRQFKGKTPLVLHKVTPGFTSILLTHPMHKDWMTTIVLESTEAKELEPVLKKKTGKIVINSKPDGADIKINGVPTGKTPLVISEIEYGKYTIKISKRDYETKTEYISLYSENTKTINTRLLPGKAKLTIKGSPAGADILINNELAGNMPLTKNEMDAGEYSIRITASGYENQKAKIKLLPNKTSDIKIDLTRKSNKRAFYRSLCLPGLGQHYLGKNQKTVIFPILEIGAITGILLCEKNFSKANSDYNTARTNYSQTAEQYLLDRYYAQMKNYYNEIKSAEKKRNFFIGAAVGIWIWNAVDALLFSSNSDTMTRMNENSDVKLSSSNFDGKQLIGLNINF